MALRDGEVGHLIAAQNVVFLHLFGDPDRVGDGGVDQIGIKVVGEKPGHFCFAFDVFGARIAQPFFIADQLAGEDAQQGVMGLDIASAEVMGIVGGDQLDPQFGADARHLDIDESIFQSAVILNFQVKVVAKDTLIPTGHLPCHLRSTLQNRLGDLAPQAGGGDDQPLAVLLQQLFVDAGPRENPPAPHALQVADAGELDQIAVARDVLGQHHQVIAPFFFGLGIRDRAVDHIHLIADDRLDAGLGAKFQQFDGAVHDAVVRERQGWHAQLNRPLHHCRQLGGAVQQAVVAVVVEGDEGQGAGGWRRKSG